VHDRRGAEARLVREDAARDAVADRLRDRGAREAAAMLQAVIAAIRGAAVGAGSTIILPADYRIAATDSRFGYVFTRRGFFPEGASAWHLPRIVGMGRATDWMLTGRVFPATTGSTTRPPAFVRARATRCHVPFRRTWSETRRPAGEIAESREFSLGLLLEVTGDLQSDRAFPGENGFGVGTVRLDVRGELDGGWGYRVQTEFGGILDAFLSFRAHPSVVVDGGLFKAPFSAEFLLPSADIDMIDRPQIVRGLVPRRKVGAQVRGAPDDGPFAYRVGVFNRGGPIGGSADPVVAEHASL
jgi:hypothetical protein